MFNERKTNYMYIQCIMNVVYISTLPTQTLSCTHAHHVLLMFGIPYLVSSAIYKAHTDSTANLLIAWDVVAVMSKKFVVSYILLLSK